MELMIEWLKVITLIYAGYFLGAFVYRKLVIYVMKTFNKNIYNGYIQFYIVICSIVAIAFSLNHIGFSI